jgi:PII-like signaling protein
MVEDGMRMSVYFGERDRAGAQLLADALLELFADSGVRSSILLRGIEGFGIKHRLQSERLLTLSEDLPLIALAVDSQPRIEALLAQVQTISAHGLITLERARLLSGGVAGAELSPGPDAFKLTIYLGRHERVGSRPAHMAVVECLHRHGVAGASVLLGLDGTAHVFSLVTRRSR